MYVWPVFCSWISFVFADIFGLCSFFIFALPNKFNISIIFVFLMLFFLVVGMLFSLLRIFQLRLDTQLNKYEHHKYLQTKLENDDEI